MTRRLLAILTLTLMLIGFLYFPVLAAEAENVPVTINLQEQSFSMPDATDDNDKLLQQYINRVLSGQIGTKKRTIKSSKAIGTLLEGFTQDAYNFLVPHIQSVADGKQSSTIFRYSKTFSNESADIAQQELLEYHNSLDLSKLLHALLNDFPYELYWYDKTQGMEINPPEDGISGTYQNGRYVYNMYWDFVMFVSVDYQAENNTTFNIQLPERINAAKENILSIINNNAQKSDINKLTSYKDKICEITNYNSSAANNNSTHYGDPWQLIYVFDGDETTTVVCEGYSKAFKYLCDRTEFGGDIDCILATGTMTGGTGAGPHMWNIVKMPNNKNYMVDVTNTDSGNPGLFLSGYTSIIDSGYKYSNGGLSFEYDSDTLSTYDVDTWLTMSDTDYTEEPVYIHFADSITDSTAEDASVLCGYPYVFTECPFSVPGFTFKGWQIHGDETDKLYNAGDKERIFEETTFVAIWEAPSFGTPDFILPEQIRTIGSEAFQGTDPHVVKIPNLNSGSQTIQSSAFSGCSNLRQVYIPASVDSIGENAFAGCAESLIIFGFEGSAAQIYADNNDILFVPVTE